MVQLLVLQMAFERILANKKIEDHKCSKQFATVVGQYRETCNSNKACFVDSCVAFPLNLISSVESWCTHGVYLFRNQVIKKY